MRGNWSFLHEWVIYDYLMVRYEERNLRLRLRVKSGHLIRKETWFEVTGLQPILNTTFPDIKGLTLKGFQKKRPAEIKFTTSLFKYHSDPQYRTRFDDFLINDGFIIVLSHDYLPSDLTKNKVDVFEIDKSDFIAFCRENFIRLLNRQIRQHDSNKYWIMYQGPNFNSNNGDILPARKSGIWCPTDNLTGFDLAVGDKILFVKTIGASTQEVQRNYLNNNSIVSTWSLQELWIGEITSTIYSREEYCQIKGYSYETKLWVNDTKKDNQWRWKRVFEFKLITEIKNDVILSNLFKNGRTKGFVEAVLESFCYRKSREILETEYQALLEALINERN